MLNGSQYFEPPMKDYRQPPVASLNDISNKHLTPNAKTRIDYLREIRSLLRRNMVDEVR